VSDQLTDGFALPPAGVHTLAAKSGTPGRLDASGIARHGRFRMTDQNVPRWICVLDFDMPACGESASSATDTPFSEGAVSVQFALSKRLITPATGWTTMTHGAEMAALCRKPRLHEPGWATSARNRSLPRPRRSDVCNSRNWPVSSVKNGATSTKGSYVLS
jgi:hypothetical protein